VAGQLLTHVPDHFEPARHVIERLGHILADPPQGAAARGAGVIGWMKHLFARQMVGQRPAGRLLRFDRTLDDASRLGEGHCQPLGLVALQRLDRQLELLRLARQLLRRAPELGPPRDKPVG
jgi:hypothetical protein